MIARRPGVRTGLLILMTLSLLGALAFIPATVEAQCAMCRANLAGADAQGAASALRSGILFLLAAPFLAFAAVAFLAVRAQRRIMNGRV